MLLPQWLGRGLHILIWPALFFYLRKGARTRVLVLADNHALLVKGWLSDGRWGLPGGGLHTHEAPDAGAVRETLEEAGVDLSRSSLISLGGESRGHHGLKFYCHFFSAQLPERVPLKAQRGEIVAAEWVPISELNGLEAKAEVARALDLLAEQP